MPVTVRYLKNNAVRKMAKRYADTLLKLKLVEIVKDEKSTVPVSFKSSIVTKPVTSQDTIQKTVLPKTETKTETKVAKPLETGKKEFPFPKKTEIKKEELDSTLEKDE